MVVIFYNIIIDFKVNSEHATTTISNVVAGIPHNISVKHTVTLLQLYSYTINPVKNSTTLDLNCRRCSQIHFRPLLNRTKVPKNS